MYGNVCAIPLSEKQRIRSVSSVVFIGGRSLRLMHATVEDAGRYTCIVSNAAGEDRKNFDLDVLGNIMDRLWAIVIF